MERMLFECTSSTLLLCVLNRSDSAKMVWRVLSNRYFCHGLMPSVSWCKTSKDGSQAETNSSHRQKKFAQLLILLMYGSRQQLKDLSNLFMKKCRPTDFTLLCLNWSDLLTNLPTGMFVSIVTVSRARREMIRMPKLDCRFSMMSCSMSRLSWLLSLLSSLSISTSIFVKCSLPMLKQRTEVDRRIQLWLERVILFIILLFQHMTQHALIRTLSMRWKYCKRLWNLAVIFVRSASLT
mmetsp:Transcript_23165/g.34349  ORF Transcript_23165/g.34349 Transcript_23165/m.34349 type:complete len:237 (+) Transcript_23165:1391-2101(+)